MDNNTPENCQAAVAEIRVSFGDLHKQVVRAKKGYQLTGDEAHLLQTYIVFINRPGYSSDMNQIMDKTILSWAEEAGMQRPHASRAFKGLKEKSILIEEKIGRQKTHAFHPDFIRAVIEKTTRDKYQSGTNRKASNDTEVIHTNVDNSEKEYRSGTDIGTDLVRDEYQSGTQICTDSVRDEYQIGTNALCIEDSLPNSLPNSLSLFPSSNFPTPNSGDNFGLSDRLASFCGNDQGIAAQFITQRKNNGVGQEQLEAFADWLKGEGKTGLDAEALKKAYLRFFTKEEDRVRDEAKLAAANDLDIKESTERPIPAEEIPFLKRLSRFAEEKDLAASFIENITKIAHDDILPLFIDHLETMEAPRLNQQEMIDVWFDWRKEKRDDIRKYQMQIMSENRT